MTRLLDQARALHKRVWELPVGPVCRHAAMAVAWWAESLGVPVRLAWLHMRGKPIRFRHVLPEILLDKRGERAPDLGRPGRWYAIDSRCVDVKADQWEPWSGHYDGDHRTPMRSARWYSDMLDDGREFSAALGDYLLAMRGESSELSALVTPRELAAARASWAKIPGELAAAGYDGPRGREWVSA